MNDAKAFTRQEYRIPGLSPPLSHYTDAVRFGNLLFVSGVTALDEIGAVTNPNDAVGQTRDIFKSLHKILRAAGADFKDVLRVTVYLTDVNDRAKINPIRKEFFGSTRPASTLIGVAALVFPELKVEIDAVAGIPGD
jgi:2-iminobutanoate/2-iminopropanoate deaminase